MGQWASVPRASLARRPMHRHFRHSSTAESQQQLPGPLLPIQSTSPYQLILRRRLDPSRILRRLKIPDDLRRPSPRTGRANPPQDDRRRLSATDRVPPFPAHSSPRTPPEAPISRWPRGKRFFSRFALPDGRLEIWWLGLADDGARTQVIILGDSGVGKTSLMNQYVCTPSATRARELGADFLVPAQSRSTSGSVPATRPRSAPTSSRARCRWMTVR